METFSKLEIKKQELLTIIMKYCPFTCSRWLNHIFHLGDITTKTCLFLAKERTKKNFEPFLDDVIVIIANDLLLGFCCKRKDILSELNFPNEHFFNFLVIVLTMSCYC